MEVKIEAVSYIATSNKLKNAHKALSDARPSLDARSSRSMTMDEFEKRILELKNLVDAYEKLLESDSTAFCEVADVFFQADKKAAAEYVKDQTATFYKKGGRSAGGYSSGGGAR